MTNHNNHEHAWQSILSNSRIKVNDLLDILGLKTHDFLPKPLDIYQFPLRVTPSFIKKIKPNDPKDPLLLQILPTDAELQTHPGYTQDPLLESESNPISGLLHKFYGRVLITFSGTCAIHCRYCFRKNFPYKLNLPSPENQRKIYQYILNDPTISEVILSGGDPLVFKNDFLFEFINVIESIPHIKRIRIHTRIPIVLPERITHQFIDHLKQTKSKLVIVIHCNHPNEIDADVSQSLKLLKQIGVTLLNHSVFLKNINDDATTLSQLSIKLFDNGVLPYYLNVLDKVSGSHPYYLEETKIQAIFKELLSLLPGYLVPKVVYEQPGVPYKIPVNFV